MERLQKVIAHAGITSRRKAEVLITQGRVKVNGQVVIDLGTKVQSQDQVEVDGVPIYREEPRYLLLYKPKNYISAVEDDKGRPVVTELLEGIHERVYPVGRLDFDTTGLLLLTNDGDFANLLIHPRYQMNKTYIAKVSGLVTPEVISRLEEGIRLDKRTTAPAKAKILSHNRDKATSIVELTIHEGWNHQVKRMLEACGHPVIKLKRENFAFLDLGVLNPGEWRELTAFEVDKLRKMAGGEA